MQANIFYKTAADGSVPLVLLTKAQCDNGLPQLTLFERNCMAVQQFKGLSGDLCAISNREGMLDKLFIGTGLGLDALAIAQAVTRIPPGCYHPSETLSSQAVLIWSLAQYRFDRYKSVDSLPRVLMVKESTLTPILVKAAAVFLVRDLINMPANIMNPQSLAEAVGTLAREHGAEFKQWIGDELLQDNFPAIHAVGRAASKAPRLLSLKWGDPSHPRVTLVGKGVCFDSGGLDIKPSSGMRLMKKDMGGAAQVIGLAHWLMAQQLPIRLHVLVPAVENAISSEAYRPGDILTMRNGLHVEIDNTDAEGRLILADALVKACEENPAVIIDFATLTGAAGVAVGTEIAAMFTNDDQLAEAISACALEVNDPVWRMPLFAGYAGMNDSSIADLANSSASSYAGAITAALFLQRFVTDGLSWVHFDIMAWNVSNKPGRPEGGEAMGLLAVGQYLINKYGNKG